MFPLLRAWGEVRFEYIAFVVLERSSGIQLVFIKRLDLQPSAEDDDKGAEDDGDVRGRVVVGSAAEQLGS